LDVDPGSCAGVTLNTTAAAGSCANPVYPGPFSLSAGTHSLSFFSEDHVANREPVRTSSVTALPAGFGMISGTITDAAGFAAGAAVTLVISNDGFASQPSVVAVTAPGGTALPYSLTLSAPAGWQLGAFAGADPKQISSATPIGF
jgi:hypothetical protein